MVALDLNGLKLFPLYLDVRALSQLVTTAFLFAFNDVAGLGIDHLLLQAVAGFPVDHVEMGLFSRCRGWIKRHRA